MDIELIKANLLPTSRVQTPSSKLLGVLNAVSKAELSELLKSLYEANVANRGLQVKFDQYTYEKISKVSSWLFTSKKPGLLLYGKCGTGKTTMIRCILRMMKADRKIEDVRFLTAKELYDCYRDESRKNHYVGVSQAKVVFIDDLGCEPEKCLIYGTEYTPIRDFIYYRYDHQLFTIISTNLDDDALTKRYGERVWDRMQEAFDRILYAGDSYRG